jgi:hypothetical protein
MELYTSFLGLVKVEPATVTIIGHGQHVFLPNLGYFAGF